MNKIGVLGGAFNPPTVGHIKLAEHVLSQTDLDEVWLMPCYDHLHGKKLESANHRINMCILASNNEKIRVSNYEIKHQMDGSTFSLVTALLKDPQFNIELSFIIGLDNANNFRKFKNSDELTKLVRFIVVPRGGITADKSVDWYKKSPHIFLPWKDEIECSSTMAREALKCNRDEIDECLSKDVYNYIKENSLYI